MEENSTNGNTCRRVIDAHSVPHQRMPKSAKACDPADVMDGFASLQNLTLKLVSTAFGVSISSVVAAQRLTPDQRAAVRRGQRPLSLPGATMALPVRQPADVVSALGTIVTEFGTVGTLNALASLGVIERQAAGVQPINLNPTDWKRVLGAN